MTKDKLIEFVERCENDKTEVPYGYMVIAFSKSDIEDYYPDLVDNYDSLSEESKQKIINRLSEKIKDMYSEWNISDDMRTLKEDFADWIEQER